LSVTAFVLWAAVERKKTGTCLDRRRHHSTSTSILRSGLAAATAVPETAFLGHKLARNLKDVTYSIKSVQIRRMGVIVHPW
jgi:hypothetical protein